MSSSLFGRKPRKSLNRFNIGGNATRTLPKSNAGSSFGRMAPGGFRRQSQSQGQIVVPPPSNQQRQNQGQISRQSSEEIQEEILRDLKLLQGHQEKSQRNLRCAQRAKAQKEGKRLSLEQKCESCKYANGEQRVQLERNRALLDTCDRVLSSRKFSGDKACTAVKDFNKELAKALRECRNNNSIKRKITVSLIFSSNKAKRLLRLKTKARSKPQQLEKMRDIARHELESLRRSVSEEADQNRVFSELHSKVTDEIFALDQEFSATQANEASTKVSMQRLDDEIEECKKNQSKVLAALTKGLEECAEQEVASDALNKEMQSRADEVTQESSHRQDCLAQLLEKEGHGSDPDHGVVGPFNCASGISLIESTMRSEHEALEHARTEKQELLESIKRLKNKDSLCHERALSARAKINQVSKEIHEEQQQETERRNTLDKHLSDVDDTRMELEQLHDSFADINTSRTKQQGQAAEKSSDTLRAIEKEKQDISSLTTELHSMSASFNSLRESWLQTETANESKKAEVKCLVENARTRFEAVKADLEDMASLKETPLSLEKEKLYVTAETDELEAEIRKILEDHPVLEQVVLLTEQNVNTNVSLDDQAKQCLEPIIKAWTAEIKAAGNRVDIDRQAAIAEAEKKRKQEAEKRRVEEEQKRKQEEAEKRRIEAERKYKQEEAVKRRIEAERKRKQEAAQKRRVEAERKRKQEEVGEKQRVKAGRKGKERDLEVQRADEVTRNESDRKQKSKDRHYGANQLRSSEAAVDKNVPKTSKSNKGSNAYSKIAGEYEALSDLKMTTSVPKRLEGGERTNRKQHGDGWKETDEDGGDDLDSHPEESFAFQDRNTEKLIISRELSQPVSVALSTPKRRPSLRDASASFHSHSSSHKRVHWKDESDDEELSEVEDMGPLAQDRNHLESSKNQPKPVRSKDADSQGGESSSRRGQVKLQKPGQARKKYRSEAFNEGGVLGSTIIMTKPKTRVPTSSKPKTAGRDSLGDGSRRSGVERTRTISKKGQSTSSIKKSSVQEDVSGLAAEKDQSSKIRTKRRLSLTSGSGKSSRPSNEQSKHTSGKVRHPSSAKANSSSVASTKNSTSSRKRHSLDDQVGRKKPKTSATERARKPRRKTKKKDIIGVARTTSSSTFGKDFDFQF